MLAIVRSAGPLRTLFGICLQRDFGLTILNFLADSIKFKYFILVVGYLSKIQLTKANRYIHKEVFVEY